MTGARASKLPTLANLLGQKQRPQRQPLTQLFQSESCFWMEISFLSSLDETKELASSFGETEESASSKDEGAFECSAIHSMPPASTFTVMAH
jgi:hypothetical protein